MIAREGLVPIGVVVVSAIAVAYFASAAWSLPLWVVAVLLLFVFRDFAPDIPNLPMAVLSPGDGRVVDVTTGRDPWLDRESCRVRIHLDGLGIGVLRSPVEGKVMDYWTSSQPFNEPDVLPATGFSPNCYSTWLKTDEGDDIVFAVSSLRPISRFKLYAAPGERIGIGKRTGFIYFGNVIDVYMPITTRTEVTAGAAVVSGATVLGRLRGPQDIPAAG